MRYTSFTEALASLPPVLSYSVMIRSYNCGDHYEYEVTVKVDETPGREAVVTGSEKIADQMRQDILGGKIDSAGRQIVRRALDTKDAPPTGREATDGALGRISRRGGF